MKARFAGPVLCVLTSCGLFAQSAQPPSAGCGASAGVEWAYAVHRVQEQLGLRLESQKGPR